MNTLIKLPAVGRRGKLELMAGDWVAIAPVGLGGAAGAV